MTWSNKSIPKSCPHSLSLSVVLISSFEGVVSPDGWLCKTIIALLAHLIASLNISLGCTIEAFNVPINIVFFL